MRQGDSSLFLNEEDEKIRKYIFSFDFQRFGVPTGNLDRDLRDKLFLGIVGSIGRCSECASFDSAKSFCKTLLTITSEYDRCSDFDRKEQSEKDSAFDIMLGHHGKFGGNENAPEPEAETS